MNLLVLVRHGESEQQAKDLTGGWTDCELTERGQRQAMLVGQRLFRVLEDRPFRLYSSDLKRAAETARIIGDIFDTRPTLHPELRELNNGDAANLIRADAKHLERPITEPIHDWIAYPNGESWRDMTRRVHAFMEEMEAMTAQAAVVVAHGTSGVAVVQWWLGLTEPVKPAISFELDLASITILGINFWGERTIARLNDTSHLGVVSEQIPLLPGKTSG